jgi:hypothetical protein
MNFNRIDEWHSIIGLSEVTEYPKTWKLVSDSEKTQHDSFPANQDAVSTLTFIDDKYTYIVNQVHCYDNHEGPQLMAFILRLDKKEATNFRDFMVMS